MPYISYVSMLRSERVVGGRGGGGEAGHSGADEMAQRMLPPSSRSSITVLAGEAGQREASRQRRTRAR